MRLQRHLVRIVKGKEYFKWVVIIPPEGIIELGWKEGMELETRMFNDGLILLPKKLKSR